MTSQAPRLSPLHDRHIARGAKFAAFGGWDMPLEYAGGGVLREHTAVRSAVGVFDVSHLGKAEVRGPGAAAFLNGCLSADLDRVAAAVAPSFLEPALRWLAYTVETETLLLEVADSTGRISGLIEAAKQYSQMEMALKERVS